LSIVSEPQNFIDFNKARNLVRDQEVDGSNPFAPTIPFRVRPTAVTRQLQGLECCRMQLWFARKSAVTLREQLVTQIILGILSDDLHSGQRLPSTRELARRFRLHPNTVSAGYRQLERERWVEFRRGSGVYVRDTKPGNALSPAFALDQLVGDLLRSAHRLGIPMATLRSRLRHWFELQPPDHFLLIEPDKELRRILRVEMQRAVTLPVKSCDLQDAQVLQELEGAVPVALAGKGKIVQQKLPKGAELLILQVRSVPTSLADWLPAPSGVLVGVASRWPGFLKLARTMLVAAGFHPDSLVFRDARKPDWQRGLKETGVVVCDTVTESDLLKTSRALQFPLISEASLAELRRYEQFIRSPLVLPI
jgi:DNA-binding transcriptional regulator YhcF (GntR family)